MTNDQYPMTNWWRLLSIVRFGYWVLGIGYWVLGIGYWVFQKRIQSIQAPCCFADVYRLAACPQKGSQKYPMTNIQ